MAMKIYVGYWDDENTYIKQKLRKFNLMVNDMNRETLISIIQEEIEDVMKEREMTSGHEDKKERIVKDLKAKIPYLKKKYGDRWKAVMYAVATKAALKDMTEKLDPVGQEDDDIDNDGDSDDSDDYLKNRRKAVSKSVDEADDMSDKEVDNREKIADRLMKKKADFKKRYGDNWEDVLYATATKLAMSGDTGEEEND